MEKQAINVRYATKAVLCAMLSKLFGDNYQVDESGSTYHIEVPRRLTDDEILELQRESGYA
ncbi:hypothetical protein F5Y13DRAFT_21785 [Hypoxylon sp. FL1857]|nr:hypothetical protein F5Y13DRAFT_21785 [Hypoxylon sp. FL1857]